MCGGVGQHILFIHYRLLQNTFSKPTGVHFQLFFCKTFTFFWQLYLFHKLHLPNPTNTLSHPTSGPHPPNPRPCLGTPLQNILLARSQSFDSQPYTHSNSKHNAPQLSVLYTIVKLVAKLCCIANKLLVVVPHHTSHRCSSVAKQARYSHLHSWPLSQQLAFGKYNCFIRSTSSLSSSPFM